MPPPCLTSRSMGSRGLHAEGVDTSRQAATANAFERLERMTLTAKAIEVDGVLRQPFGRIVINGEHTPQLGANSVLSVSGDGVKVPVGTTINQAQWLYLADGSTWRSIPLRQPPFRLTNVC